MTDHNIRRFTAYRPAVSPFTHNEDQRNAPDEVQYEGVVFSDGSCALRWRTAVHSTSFWDSFEDAMRIHGHPEYGTRIVFHDEPIQLPWDPDPAADIPTDIEAFRLLIGAIFGGQINVEAVDLPDAAEAWRIVQQQLDEDCGYEGSELDDPEIAARVERFRQAWDVLDDYFDED